MRHPLLRGMAQVPDHERPAHTTMIATAETAIPLLEQSWMDAWVAKDRATCERILGDDFLRHGMGPLAE